MKAHSAGLSVVRVAEQSALNETTEAVPGIVKQLVIVAPHISSIFISSFFMSLFIPWLLCV